MHGHCATLPSTLLSPACVQVVVPPSVASEGGKETVRVGINGFGRIGACSACCSCCSCCCCAALDLLPCSAKGA